MAEIAGVKPNIFLIKKRSRGVSKKAVKAFFELEANSGKEKTEDQMYMDLMGGENPQKKGGEKQKGKKDKAQKENPQKKGGEKQKGKKDKAQKGLQKGRKAFRLCAKSCLLTYPQCDKPKEWLMEKLMTFHPVIVVVSKEDHHESDGKHLHAYVEFNRKLDVTDPRHFDFDGFHPNIGQDKSYGKKSAKSSKIDIIRYVIKDGDYVEYGIDAKKYLECAKSKKAYVDEKLVKGEMTLVEAVEEYPHLIHEYGKLKANLQAFRSDKSTQYINANEYIKKLCVWVWGRPGIGKSFGVRKWFKNIYNKMDNKWWNNYRGEETVLIDDFDNKELFHELKIWADNYLFDAEIKGGYITPNIKNFIVTSNYSIDDLVIQTTLRDAIKRRFIEINANNYIVNGYFDLKVALKSYGVDLGDGDGDGGVVESVNKRFVELGLANMKKIIN